MVRVPCFARVWTKDKNIYKKFRTGLVPSLAAAGSISGLTESPLSTPVVQIGDVGEHVINPVIRESRVMYDKAEVADQ